jgi:cytoskeletal protein RodZ
MKTIGEIFRKRRIENNISIEDVERSTKIRKTFIEFLEKGEYEKLPPAAFTRGFVKNYSEFLGLDSKEIIALYRREFDEQKDKRLLPKGVSESYGEGLFAITPKKFTYLAIGLLIIFFVIYVTVQYFRLSGAPLLIIQSPQDNIVVASRELEVVGKTDYDAVIKLNGQTIFNREGKFSQTISLVVGLNTITIEATGRNGKSVKSEKHIRLLSP